jgi:hypothetical protein
MENQAIIRCHRFADAVGCHASIFSENIIQWQKRDVNFFG